MMMGREVRPEVTAGKGGWSPAPPFKSWNLSQFMPNSGYFQFDVEEEEKAAATIGYEIITS